MDDVELHEGGSEDDGFLKSDEYMCFGRIRKPDRKQKLFILAVLVVVGAILFTIVSGSFFIGFLTGNAFGGDMNNQDKYVKYNYNEVYPDRNDPKQVNIMDTREFQDNIDLDKYRDRMNTITQMIVALNDLTGENLDDDDFDAEIYEERHYDTSNCGVKYSEFRRRRFFKSKKGTVKENETTFDINMDEPKKIDALTKWDLTPSENYKSEQKIEHGK